MKVYLAAPYVVRDPLRLSVAGVVRAAGHEVTSTWLEETHDGPGSLGTAPALTLQQVAEHARDDLADVERSDVLVQVTSNYCLQAGWARVADQPRLMTGGRSVEMGYALAHDLPVIVLGQPENIFQRALSLHASTSLGVIRLLRDLVENQGHSRPTNPLHR